MRVVGGKTGADGKLFAHIVWTVPGGPAEKGGLQQGDKILEWCGISLVDRSFEEVCSIMDRTTDIAELLVEHASDFRMCDFLEDNNGSQQTILNSQGSLSNPIINVTQRKNSDVGLIAGKTNTRRWWIRRCCSRTLSVLPERTISKTKTKMNFSSFLLFLPRTRKQRKVTRISNT